MGHAYDCQVLVSYIDPDLEEIGFSRTLPTYEYNGPGVEFGTRDIARALFGATTKDPVTIPLPIGSWDDPMILRIVVLQVQAWYPPDGARSRRNGQERTRDWYRSWCLDGYVLDPPEWTGFAHGTHIRMYLAPRTIPRREDVRDDEPLSPPTYQFYDPAGQRQGA